MEYKVAFYSRLQTEEKIVKEQFPGLRVDYYYVDSLMDLKEAFLATEKEYDGFLSSGVFSDRFISLLSPRRDVPQEYFNTTVESYYRYLLEKSVLSPGLDLGSIRLDLMGEQDDLREIVLHNRLEQMMTDEVVMVRNFTEDQTITYEQEMVTRHRRAIEEGRIRFFVTRSVVAIRMFEERGVPYHFIEPTRNEILYKIDLLRKGLELQTMKNGLTALIYFDMRSEEAGARGEERSLKFQQAIYNFSQKTGYNLILKPVQTDFEIYTDAQTVQQMTENFTRSPLYEYLRQELRFKGGVGYGIGISLQQARENAYEAAALSARRASEGVFQSYLINNQNNIILLANHRVRKGDGQTEAVSSDFVEKVASRCRLSSENVLKILEFSRSSGNEELTSEILTNRLGVSLRTANKILSHLEEGGAAQIVGQKRLGLKGRPVNIYRICMEEK